MMFKGQEQDDGNIVLVAQHPPGCLARIEATLQRWLGRALVAGLWFGLGVAVGLLLAG